VGLRAATLEKTGTPVARTVHVQPGALKAIHVDWYSGARIMGQSVLADEVRHMDLKPNASRRRSSDSNSKLATFRQQRVINEFKGGASVSDLAGCCSKSRVDWLPLQKQHSRPSLSWSWRQRCSAGHYPDNVQ
jgi:hypothetical protein